MTIPKTLPEAAITINGTPLSQTQAGSVRVALQFARRDLELAPADLLSAGIKQNVDDVLAMIDDTPVQL